MTPEQIKKALMTRDQTPMRRAQSIVVLSEAAREYMELLIRKDEMTSETRQHFELIAEVIAYRRAAVQMLADDTVKGRAAETTALQELNFVSWGFAHALADTNPRFDRERFLEAAGVTI